MKTSGEVTYGHTIIPGKATIGDFVEPARKRLPAFAFNTLAGGAGNDSGVAENEAAFRRRFFVSRRFAPASTDQTATVFGHSYASPFGVAPMGLANLFYPGTDLLLAQAAQAGNFPFVLSTAASTSIERITKVAPDVSWYQLYLLRDNRRNAEVLSRVAGCGVAVLVLTVDVPVAGRRNSAIRDGVTLPLRWTSALLTDVMRHPQWALGMLCHGVPKLENYAPHAGSDDVGAASRHIASVMKVGLEWDDLEKVRAMWPGKLVIKGILHPDDAARSVALGADGIWVSNHGGRQLEGAIASLDALPAIRRAVGRDTAVFLDGGVRTGEDVLKACALGADLCFSARSFALPVAAYGERGVRAAVDMLKEEIRVGLAQLGVQSLSALTSDSLSSVARASASDNSFEPQVSCKEKI
ncbi:alpha-hydroxy acid oxidase [Paraburkholderia sp. BL25I1N1]|uniref:alpha-hydroxy acid oxidase n=1 Tax=Paraburkholderia sp. BL25I1N1 TaxID=1938804 RepID=UPI000D0643C5|nr:alpha-hydroxy acid oxidase [Paraburkholderia sp. BL25I1N1]PRX97586.1 L-lactate dehydrogenase (cytochrome) [Paraburkholderia sp. BL25I1N1]